MAFMLACTTLFSYYFPFPNLYLPPQALLHPAVPVAISNSMMRADSAGWGNGGKRLFCLNSVEAIFSGNRECQGHNSTAQFTT